MCWITFAFVLRAPEAYRAFHGAPVGVYTPEGQLELSLGVMAVALVFVVYSLSWAATRPASTATHL